MCEWFPVRWCACRRSCRLLFLIFVSNSGNYSGCHNYFIQWRSKNFSENGVMNKAWNEDYDDYGEWNIFSDRMVSISSHVPCFPAADNPHQMMCAKNAQKTNPEEPYKRCCEGAGQEMNAPPNSPAQQGRFSEKFYRNRNQRFGTEQRYESGLSIIVYMESFGSIVMSRFPDPQGDQSVLAMTVSQNNLREWKSSWLQHHTEETRVRWKKSFLT